MLPQALPVPQGRFLNTRRRGRAAFASSSRCLSHSGWLSLSRGNLFASSANEALRVSAGIVLLDECHAAV